MNKQLQNKLKAYSALTAAGVLASANADAAIIHKNVNYSASNETYNVDIDGDGTNDFFLTQNYPWAGGTYGAGCPVQGGYFQFGFTGSNGFEWGGYYNGMFNLASGAIIGTSATYGFYNNPGYFNVAAYAFQCSSWAGTWSSGYWGGSQSGEKLIGVRFDISGNTHYGWMRVNIDVLNSQLTLIDMAYNCIPGQGILAGQTTGGTAPTADSGSLADFYACGSVNSVGDLTAPTATSDCGASLVGTTNAAFPISAATTITWTYDDGYGNTSTQNQNIYFVVDLGVTLLNPTTLSSSETDATATYQWVDCDNGNAAISGATSKDFSPSATGNYAVEVTVGSCTVTSPCTYFTLPLGVNSADKQITNVHPNPATEEIIINLAEVGANTTMTVVDVTGKVVKVINVTDNKTVINLTDLNSGIYLVKISSDQGMNTIKFVKK